MNEATIRNFENQWNCIKDESITYKHSGPEMVVMSILSDVQELLERDQKDEANYMINFAKFILSEVRREKEEN